MTHPSRTMSTPTASLVRTFSQFGHPQHPIEEYEPKGEAPHRKRGRSLSTPSLNTQEWRQFRMLDATTPRVGSCDPTPSCRPRSAPFNPSPVIACTEPSFGNRSYEQVGCLRDHVEVTKPSESPATIPEEQAVATKNQVNHHGPEHLMEMETPNADPIPLAGAGGPLGSLLKRRNAPRCFFSPVELYFPDDGRYQGFSDTSD